MNSGIDKTNKQLVGILSDAHGNGPAFDLAIEILRGLGVESFRFLGDSVGYIPSLSVIASLRELGSSVHCIMGNHEQMLLADYREPGRDAVYQLSQIKDHMSPEDIAMVAGWRVARIEQSGGQAALFVHGSPSDPTNGYVYPDTELTAFHPNADIVFMGHTHRPFIREHEGVRYVNVGSCGLPRDDGRFGSAALYDTASSEVRILRFNIAEETKSALASAPRVHPSIRDVLTRREASIFGDLI